MKVGALLPQSELDLDPITMRDFAQAVEGMGYAHIAMFDHVLGADIAERPNWTGPYTSDHRFREPMVVMGFLSGVTTKLELVPEVMVVPQRQTALVAKQAAEVDLLSRGRLRLGMGVGWNEVEYQGMGFDFHTRGKRLEEQIQLLRALWTQEVVEFQGRWDRIDRSGINPLPVQRPIPIWMAAIKPAALARMVRYADGWFPSAAGDMDFAARQMDLMRACAEQAGRDPISLGVEPRMSLVDGTPDTWRAESERWKELGATHVTVVSAGGGTNWRAVDETRFKTLDERIKALGQFIAAIA